MALDYVLISSVIYDLESVVVTMKDILRAYLYIYMDKNVYMKLDGSLSEFLVLTCPKIYSNHMTIGKVINSIFTSNSISH